MSTDSSPHVQKRLRYFLKTYYEMIIIQLGLSFLTSLFFLFFHSSQIYHISANLSNLILSSLIDVFIALFGFVGLILVFILRNLITTRAELEKERFETVIRSAELHFQAVQAGRIGGSISDDKLKDAEETIKRRLNDIDDNLTRNKEKTEDALFFGRLAIGSAVTCVLINVWAFGAITNKGLNFLNITLLLSLFFLCIDFTFEGIRTVIR